MRTEWSRFIVTIISACATRTIALPQFASHIRTRSAFQFPSASHFEARGLLQDLTAIMNDVPNKTGLLQNVTSIINDIPIATNLLPNVKAILNAIPTSFNLPVVSVGRKVIPDADHPFMPPGPTDVRGGCPGLNLLANYGYIPRSGITDMTTLLFAMQEALGIGLDLGLLLIAFALKTCVDLTTLKMSIGDTDSRTDGPLTFLLGRAPGLFSPATHNRYEVDGSLATVDAYFAGGHTNQFDGLRWATWYQLAETKYNGIMSVAWNGDVRFMQYNMCRNSNPQCHWAVVDQLVFYLAQAFIPTVMPSAGADGLPGPAFVDSINQFMGIVKQSDGTFTRGHSHLPPGPEGVWYRRTIPLTIVELGLAGAISLTSHLPQFGHNDGTLGSWNADPTQLPNLIAGPPLACSLLKSVIDPSGTRFQGVAQIALKTLLDFVLATVESQISCS